LDHRLSVASSRIVEKQRRLKATQLAGKCSEHQSLAKNYAATKQNNGQY
jgi:hypothetical protein